MKKNPQITVLLFCLSTTVFFWKAEHEKHTTMCTIFRGLLKIFASNVQCVRYKYVCRNFRIKKQVAKVC